MLSARLGAHGSNRSSHVPLCLLWVFVAITGVQLIDNPLVILPLSIQLSEAL